MKQRIFFVLPAFILMLSGCIAAGTQTDSVLNPTPEVTSDPDLWLSVSQAAAGDELVIRGQGFDVQDRVAIRMGTDNRFYPLEDVIADNKGEFSLTMDIPATWPNGDVIDGDEIVFQAQSRHDFVVQASLVFVPVEIVEPAQTRVAPPATPTLLVAMPGGVPATPTPTPDATRRATIDLNPTISLSPLNATTGSLITVSGDGYPADGTVLIRLTTDQEDKSLPVAQATTNSSGEFSVQFTMPASWADGSPIVSQRIKVYAQSAIDGWYSWAAFQFNP